MEKLTARDIAIQEDKRLNSSLSFHHVKQYTAVLIYIGPSVPFF